MKVTSGLGEALPVNIIVMPILFEDQVLAVVELASLREFSEVNQAFLEQLAETLGVVLNAIIANRRTEELLEQSQSLAEELQSQSEELQSQQDELKRSNSELEQQTSSLRASEELLQTQQEELQQTNEELQEKAELLSQQNRDIEVQNEEIERARLDLEEKAAQLSVSSKYKSRVPREHEPRAAHAAELAADLEQAARRQPGAEPHRQAGRVRVDDPHRGRRPARR